MRKPLLSVIIPVYNSENYINECLTSLIQQISDLSIEVIAVNDGSTDSSLEILRQFENSYSYVHVFSQENKGVSSARNYALRNSTGRYLMFLDSDDYFFLDCLGEIRKIISKRDFDCILFGLKTYRNGQMEVLGELPSESFSGARSDMYAWMMKLETPYGGYVAGKVVNRNVLFGREGLSISFDENKDMLEDEWFWLHVANKCDSIFFLNKALYCYRYSNAGISRSHSPERNKKEVFMKIKAYEFLKKCCPEVAPQALARVVLTIGGFIRRYYVLQDKQELKKIRKLWKEYPGITLLRLNEIPIFLKIASLLCDIAMILHIPVKAIKPFARLLSKGMDF